MIDAIITTTKMGYTITTGGMNRERLSVDMLRISGDGVNIDLTNVRLILEGIVFMGTIMTKMGTIRGTGSPIPYSFAWNMLKMAGVDPLMLVDAILGDDWRQDSSIIRSLQQLPDLYQILKKEGRVGGRSDIGAMTLSCDKGVCDLHMRFRLQ